MAPLTQFAVAWVILFIKSYEGYITKIKICTIKWLCGTVDAFIYSIAVLLLSSSITVTISDWLFCARLYNGIAFDNHLTYKLWHCIQICHLKSFFNFVLKERSMHAFVASTRLCVCVCVCARVWNLPLSVKYAPVVGSLPVLTLSFSWCLQP